MSLLYWLKKTVVRSWADLRGVSNSTAAKSTILIPLIGYWIVFNESAVHWLQLARQLGGGEPSDQVSTRLLWLYMALCAIGAGTFIYALRCPSEVKKYGDYKDYVNGDGPGMSITAVEDLRDFLEQVGYGELGASNAKDALGVHFDYLDKLRPYSRGAVTLLFCLGFTILTILSSQVFFRVVRLLTGI